MSRREPVGEAFLSRAGEARAILRRLLEGMRAEGEIDMWCQDGKIVLSVSTGDDANHLIGRKGRTLEAIQLVTNRILRKFAAGEGPPILVDVAGYRERRLRNLTVLAERSANQVRETGSPVTAGPFNAYERHLLHSVLREDPGVLTESLGDGDLKKIVFRVRPSDEASGHQT
jgi:spoIIIJ-associated protein